MTRYSGNAMQLVKVELDTVIAEAGAMNYVGEGSMASAIHWLIANSASLFSWQQKKPSMRAFL